MAAPRSRRCSRPSCGRPAVFTLTYVYADQTAVVGPLAVVPEPHCYDLCRTHAERQTAPLGWELVRFDLTEQEVAARDDDLIALALAVRDAADAVRASHGRPAVDTAGQPVSEGGLPARSGAPRSGPRGGPPARPARRDRGHLRVVPDPPG